MNQDTETSLLINTAAEFMGHFGNTEIEVPLNTTIVIRLSNADFSTLDRSILDAFDKWVIANHISADIALV